MTPEDVSGLFRLDGAVAIVTGASGWLGPAMVSALAHSGARVIAVSRNEDRLRAALGDVQDSGADVDLRACDVTTDAWGSLVRSVAAQHGRLDILVNNAHIGHGGSLRTASRELFDEAFQLSVQAAWEGTEAGRDGFVAAVRAGGSPSVVNVASMYGVVGPDLSLYDTEEGRTPPFYGAAKAALIQLTRYTAAELGPVGVRANAIVPGPFPAAAAQGDPEFIARLAARTMTGTIGAPQDLATALLYLASPASRFVTGSVVTVDGGWTAR